MRRACRVDLQAHFVHIPDLFFDLRSVVVGISNNLVHVAEPADDFVFSVLVMHQDLLRVDILVGRVMFSLINRLTTLLLSILPTQPSVLQNAN